MFIAFAALVAAVVIRSCAAFILLLKSSSCLSQGFFAPLRAFCLKQIQRHPWCLKCKRSFRLTACYWWPMSKCSSWVDYALVLVSVTLHPCLCLFVRPQWVLRSVFYRLCRTSVPIPTRSTILLWDIRGLLLPLTCIYASMGKRGLRGVVGKLRRADSSPQLPGEPTKQPAPLNGLVLPGPALAASTTPASTASPSTAPPLTAPLPMAPAPTLGSSFSALDSNDGSEGDDLEPAEYRHYLASPRKRGRYSTGAAYRGIARSVAVFPGGRMKDVSHASWAGPSPSAGLAAVPKGTPTGSFAGHGRLPQVIGQGLPGARPEAPSNVGYVLPVGVPHELRPVVSISKSAKRKAYEATTASRWAALLPQLVYPYLQWASKTSNGRYKVEPVADGAICTCGGAQKHAQVVSVYLDRRFFS